MSLDMDLDATTRAMNQLDAIGSDLTRDWRSAGADIAWLSGMLGNGPLGARFAALYRPRQDALERQTNAICPLAQAMAAAGRNGVATYATADAHAEAEFLRVTFR